MEDVHSEGARGYGTEQEQVSRWIIRQTGQEYWAYRMKENTKPQDTKSNSFTEMSKLTNLKNAVTCLPLK